jgi:hypothetical protein
MVNDSSWGEGARGLTFEQVFLRRHESRGNRRILHKTTAHRTKCGSQHTHRGSTVSALRNGTIATRRNPRRCHFERVRSGMRYSYSRFPNSFQLGEQFADSVPRLFVLTKLLCCVSYPSTLSKKLSLLSQMPPQFSAYLGHSFFVP